MSFGLIKIALNAQRAREMAGEVGLQPHGNWKWALRNLRDGNGDALEGRALAEAKEQMGKMPNNARQAVQSVARRVGGHKEVGAVVPTGEHMNTALKGRVNTNALKENTSPGNFEIGDAQSVNNIQRYVDEYGSSTDEIFGGLKGLGHDIHTHPYASMKKHINPEKMTNQAFDALGDDIQYYDADTLKVMRERTLGQARAAQGVGTTGPRLVEPSGDSYKLQAPKDYPAGSEFSAMNNELGDYKGYVLQNMQNPNVKSTIYDPLYGNESVHKVRPDGLRSVYFKNQGILG
jgi:hypothetical protein